MLTIVIPYFKISFFETTLKSLSSQTNKNFKVIIGDDASPDNPSELLEKYKNDFNFTYKRFDSNLGATSLVSQWNRCLGIEELNEWIMILGDDDVLESNIVQAFYDNAPNFQDSNVIRYSTYKINENDEITSHKYENPRTESATDFLFRETRSSLSEYIFRSSQVKKIGFKNFPLAWFSDVLAVLEFSDFNTIYSINEAAVHIRISDKSISGIQSNSKPKIRAAFEFYYYLLTKKKHYFDDFHFKNLMQKLSKSYLNDKKNAKNFLRISKFFFVNYYILEYLFFLKSILKSIFVKAKNQ